MVIDIHAHPLLLDEINENPEDLQFRRQEFGVFKSGINPVDFELVLLEDAKIDKVVFLPEDYSAEVGRAIVSNDEMARIVARSPEHFIGFAGIDPRREDAETELIRAFDELKLAGLKLNLSRLHIYPDDACLAPLYKICQDKNKPVMFHAGYSWEPNTPAKYSEPIRFEDVAVAYPDLRFCLAHMGFPWVKETAMMILKYPNVYADTSALYFDSAYEFYGYLFQQELGYGWLDRSLRHKVMFGSNMPRFEEMRMLAALKRLGLRDETVGLITEDNALVFLGEREQAWLG